MRPSSNNNVRLSRMNSTSSVISRMSPVVVIADLHYAVQDSMETQPGRTPFGKVNPAGLKMRMEETSSDIGRRRNASRACRKPESSSTAVSISEQESDPAPSVSLQTKRRSGRKRGKQSTCAVYAPIQAHLCKHCNENFENEEATQEHEKFCPSGPVEEASVPDQEFDPVAEARKVNFLKLLSLDLKEVGSESPKAGPSGSSCASGRNLSQFPEQIYATAQSVVVEIEPIDTKRNRSRKLQLKSFLRTNPIPFSSKVGQKLIVESNVGVCPNPEELTKKYDQFCCEVKLNRPLIRENRQTWPTSISRKMKFKRGQHVHYYSFNKTGRYIRNTEITLGLNTRACNLFNTCKLATVSVEKLPEKVAAEYMEKKRLQTQRAQQRMIALCSKKTLTVRLVDLQTTARGRRQLTQKRVKHINRS